MAPRHRPAAIRLELAGMERCPAPGQTKTGFRDGVRQWASVLRVRRQANVNRQPFLTSDRDSVANGRAGVLWRFRLCPVKVWRVAATGQPTAAKQQRPARSVVGSIDQVAVIPGRGRVMAATTRCEPTLPGRHVLTRELPRPGGRRIARVQSMARIGSRIEVGLPDKPEVHSIAAGCTCPDAVVKAISGGNGQNTLLMVTSRRYVLVSGSSRRCYRGLVKQNTIWSGWNSCVTWSCFT